MFYIPRFHGRASRKKGKTKIVCDNLQNSDRFFETDVCVFADHVCFSGGVAINHHMCVMVACWSVFGILCILTYPVRKCVYTVLDHRACYF